MRQRVNETATVSAGNHPEVGGNGRKAAQNGFKTVAFGAAKDEAGAYFTLHPPSKLMVTIRSRTHPKNG